LPGHFFHHDAQEVTTVTAFLHDWFFKLLPSQPRGCKQAAIEPRVQQTALVRRNTQIAKSGLQQMEYLGLGPIDGEISRRK
jgi:hypothetical protein